MTDRLYMRSTCGLIFEFDRYDHVHVFIGTGGDCRPVVAGELEGCIGFGIHAPRQHPGNRFTIERVFDGPPPQLEPEPMEKPEPLRVTGLDVLDADEMLNALAHSRRFALDRWADGVMSRLDDEQRAALSRARKRFR